MRWIEPFLEQSMLIMEHPVFRRFWYPTLALTDLAEGPKPFTLLGQPIVLWMQEAGRPAALVDRCPHRSARLSVDSLVVDGSLRCGYHGWRFNGQGACVLVPQMPELAPGARRGVRSFRCEARYGYAWVCLEEPLADIPHIRHSDDPGFRQVLEYAEDWSSNMLRITENALDIGHISFVHRRTFGDDANPAAPLIAMHPLENGVNFRCEVPVANRELQQRNLDIPEPQTLRIVDIKWYLPCTFVLHFTYPNGLIHEICGFATPIDNQRVRRIQFAYRNDTEADAPAAQVAEFDRAVAAEDRRILESTDFDYPLDPRDDVHMVIDRPGIEMRRVLRELLAAHEPGSAANGAAAASIEDLVR